VAYFHFWIIKAAFRILSTDPPLMPLDHYVSQVHLRKFYSPVLGDRVYAMHKRDLKAFTPNSKVVCGINDGSSNSYLQNDRAVEEFLKVIEPKYDTALNMLKTKKINTECIYTIAGFVAYVYTSSPGGMRINSEPLKRQVENSAYELDAKGAFSPPPPALGGENLTELLRSGKIEIVIDPKFPQAIGIGNILKLTALLGNFKWEVLQNDFDNSPFFTSDFPVAIEETNDPHTLNKIIPLAPNLAIRIIPDRTFDKSRADFTFANFSSHSRKVNRQEVMKINRLIVRCAEEIVFYRDDYPWVQPFIAKNRYYRIEASIREITTQLNKVSFLTQRIVQRTDIQEAGLMSASAGEE
jgi:Protein of unknown function (DUF4238)